MISSAAGDEINVNTTCCKGFEIRKDIKLVSSCLWKRCKGDRYVGVVLWMVLVHHREV